MKKQGPPPWVMNQVGMLPTPEAPVSESLACKGHSPVAVKQPIVKHRQSD
jgi:hypothetical protein